MLGRFVEVEPRRDFDFGTIRKTDPVLEWRYGGGGKAGPVPASCVPGCVGKEGGLEISASDAPATVEWQAGWRAEDVAIVDLLLTKQVPLGSPVTLRWDASANGQRWSGEYKSWSTLGEARYVFDVRLHHDWHGTIERIAFSWLSSRVVFVNRVRGVQVGVRDDWQSTLKADPVRVELAHDLRPSFVAWPGAPVKRLGVVPAGAVLRLGVGVTPHVFASVRFRVRARHGLRSEVLWERSLSQARGEAGRWIDAEVDLGRFAGREVELTLETEAEARLDPAWGLAFWANPDVIDPASDARPDVVLVSVDTLRADRLGAYGSTRGLSPELDAWAAGGTVFRQVVTTAPWTLPAHVSMLTGLDATTHGMNTDVRAPFQAESLAGMLRREGYATYGFTGGVYLHPDFGFARGFDRYTYWEDDFALRLQGELRANVSALEKTLSTRPRRPVFAFLHTYVVHEPFRFLGQPAEDLAQRRLRPGIRAREAAITYRKSEPTPENGFAGMGVACEVRDGENAQELGPDEAGIAVLQLGYDSGVRAMDREIGPMLRKLRDTGALTVFTSDHGESLGEHGRFGHGYLSDDNLMVPLVIANGAGRGSGRTVGGQVRLTDVVPTILDALGLAPANPVDGVSLLAGTRGAPVSAPRTAWSYSAGGNRGVALRFDGKLKLVWNDTAWAPLNGYGGAFDLEADPGEERPLPASDRTREMAHAAQEKLRTSAGGILDLRIVNGGAGELEVELNGPLVRPRRVKLLGEGCRCVTARDRRTLRAIVAAGQHLELRFLGSASASATLRASQRVGEAVVKAPDQRLCPKEMAGPSSLELGPQGWSSRAGNGTAAVRIVAVPGRLTAQSRGRSETQEQAKQLRDLGYLQ